MKLFLHWLRYDLRRFRLILGTWTLLVAAYAVFLGWLHLNILTISPEALDLSKPIAIALGILEFGFLFALFHSDPAAGPHHFWKTRPPTAPAIAGVKLTVAFSFFIALPFLTWKLVQLFCVIPGYVITKSPWGLSWAAFLFWAQSLALSVFALAAARAGNGKTLYLRLLAPVGTMVFGIFAFQETWNLFVKFSSLGLRWERWLRDGFFSLPMGVLALAGSSLFLLWSRRQRVFSKGLEMPGLVLIPATAMLVSAACYRKPIIRAPDELLPAADPAIAQKITLRELPYPVMYFQEIGYSYASNDPREAPEFLGSDSPRMVFLSALKAEGLPPDTVITSRWLDLRLTAPDGTVMQADAQLSIPRAGEIQGYARADQWLHAPGAVFFKKDLHPQALSRCIATGTLRLTLYSRQSQALPLLDGKIHSTPMGLLRQGSIPLHRNQADRAFTFFDFTFLDSGRPFFARIQAIKNELKVSLSVPNEDNNAETGFMVQHRRTAGWVWLADPSVSRTTEEAEALKSLYEAGSSPVGWELIFNWEEPTSVVDVPVTLHDVIPWTGRGGNGALRKALKELHPAENPSDVKVRSDLRYAYGLINCVSWPQSWSGSASEWQEGISLWRDILSEVGHEQLSVLFEFLPDEPLDPVQAQILMLYGHMPGPVIPEIQKLLEERVRTLLQPADFPAILANPGLRTKLRNFLPAPVVLPASATPLTAPVTPENSPDGSSAGKPVQ